jgi:hypothetical protein
MFVSLHDKVTNVQCESLLSHDRYQYDSLILSKQTWAYPVNSCNNCCDVKCADVVLTSRKNAWKQIFIFPVHNYANCVSTTLTVLITLKVSYLFYSDPVLSPVACLAQPYYCHIISQMALFLGLLMNIKCLFTFSSQLQNTVSVYCDCLYSCYMKLSSVMKMSARCQICMSLYVKCLFSVHFQLLDFVNKFSIWNLHKFSTVGFY